MNSLKILQIEYDGIYGTIKKYTSDSNIMNYLAQLNIGMRKKDYEIVRYSLEEIIVWYDENINAISTNALVLNLDDHYKNRQVLKELLGRLKPEDFKEEEPIDNSVQSGKKLIFLSHQSGDKKYGDALRNLIIGLGVKNEQLIYTSHELHKIPMDENIYEYLRKNIHSEIFMIILWSNTYLESPACLNEMGAAWVTQTDYTNIYVPSFEFGNPKYHECAVDTRKMGAVLNGNGHCKQSMIEFKNKIQTIFGLAKDEKNDTFLIDCFMNEIAEV